MCSKVLNEGKWAGKYHYAWDKVFPAMPPNTPRAYRKLTHACLDSKFANRPTATEILAALAVVGGADGGTRDAGDVDGGVAGPHTLGDHPGHGVKQLQGRNQDGDGQDRFCNRKWKRILNYDAWDASVVYATNSAVAGGSWGSTDARGVDGQP